MGQKRKKLLVGHPDIFGCSKESDIKEPDISIFIATINQTQTATGVLITSKNK